MTASVFAMNEEQSRIAGCDAFLPKPVEMERLLALLHTFLKVEWIYESVPATASLPNRVSEEEVLIPPSAEELEKVFELAMLGNMAGIQHQAALLEQQDARYQPFARTLQQFAAAYQDKELLNFVKRYMEAASTQHHSISSPQTKQAGFSLFWL